MFRNGHHRVLAAAAILAMSLTGCGQGAGPTASVPVFDAAPSVRVADSITAPKGHPWSFMTFLALDNDLDEGSDEYIAEINDSARGGRAVSYITEYDGPAPKDSIRYYQVNPGERMTKAPLGEINSGTPASILDLIKYQATLPPAQRKMLTLSDHGGGIVRGVLSDWNAPGGKEIMHIKDMVPYFQQYPIDVLVFDACFMQMIEVAYELRDGVRFVVGAQTTTRGSFPYAAMGEMLERNPGASSAAVAAGLVKLINQSAYYEVALGAMDTSRTPDLAPKVRALSDVLIAKIPAMRKQILQAVKQSLGYGNETAPGLQLYNDFRDLGDIARNLQKLGDKEITAVAKEVEKACQDRALVLAQLHRGERVAGGSGVMTYAATSGEVVQKYLNNNRWAQDTHWGDLLVRLNSEGTWSRPIVQDRYPWAFPSKKR